MTGPCATARDLQCLAYLAAVPALAAWQWQHGFAPLLYALMVILWIGIGVIHHHHAHRPMWHRRALNRATDLVLALLQGHPTYAFVATHNANHHRHRHGAGDWARTYRFAGGDSNHALGYLLHPLQAACVLYPHFLAHLARMRRHRRGVWRWALPQYALVGCRVGRAAGARCAEGAAVRRAAAIRRAALAAGRQLLAARACRRPIALELRAQLRPGRSTRCTSTSACTRRTMSTRTSTGAACRRCTAHCAHRVDPALEERELRALRAARDRARRAAAALSQPLADGALTPMPTHHTTTSSSPAPASICRASRRQRRHGRLHRAAQPHLGPHQAAHPGRERHPHAPLRDRRPTAARATAMRRWQPPRSAPAWPTRGCDAVGDRPAGQRHHGRRRDDAGLRQHGAGRARRAADGTRSQRRRLRRQPGRARRSRPARCSRASARRGAGRRPAKCRRACSSARASRRAATTPTSTRTSCAGCCPTAPARWCWRTATRSTPTRRACA